jgi:hypothetical protein
MARGCYAGTAFKSNFSDIKAALSNLQERVESAIMVPPKLDLGDVMRLVVPPEHRQLASDAHEILRMPGSYSYSKKINLKSGHAPLVNFSFNGFNKFPFCYPDNKNGMYDDELIPVIADWAEKQAAFDVEWFLHDRALEALNNYCETPAQVRFYTPAILTLLGMANQQKLADKLRDFKVPRTLPPIPAPLRDHLPKLTNAVARALLTPPKPKEPTSGVKVWLNSSAVTGATKVPWDVNPPITWSDRGLIDEQRI